MRASEQQQQQQQKQNNAPKKETPQPSTRTLKIQQKFVGQLMSLRQVPEIKLSGVWLAKLGFEHGKTVVITAEEKMLTIRMEGNN